jgi:AraC family ethanolamine operon transcriptional activator
MSGPAVDPFQAGFGTTLRTSSLEEHAANSLGWSLEFRQLGRGRFAGALTFALATEAQFAVNDFTPGLMVTGAPPRGTLVLGIPLAWAPVARYRGESFGRSDVVVVHPDEEVDLRVFGAGALFTATLPPSRVRAYVETVFDLPCEELLGRGRLLSELLPGERQAQLERIGLGEVFRRPGHLAAPEIARQLEEKVLHAICAGLRPAPRPRRSGSLALARRADEFLRASVDRPITIQDLCGAMRASERTLHDSFRRHFGTTPKAHLKLLRLHAAHRELERAEPGTTITGVAMRWGFFHLSWFSHDYRQLFGRTPIETLRGGRLQPAVSG